MTIQGALRVLQPNLQNFFNANSETGGAAFIDIFRDVLKTGDINRIKRLPETTASLKLSETGTATNPEKTVETGSKGKRPVDKKLLSVCRDMEALFTGIMLKSMKKTIHENDFFGKSIAKDIFSDMLYDEYAKLMAKTDQIGLARQIYDQLSE